MLLVLSFCRTDVTLAMRMAKFLALAGAVASPPMVAAGVARAEAAEHAQLLGSMKLGPYIQVTPSTAANAPNRTGLAENLEKRDQIISGHKVLIDQPVFSNGGDVIIIADSLVIAAPIDTRTRLPIRAIESNSYLFDYQLPPNSDARKAVEHYILWGDYWDSTAIRYKFKSYDLSDIDTRMPGGVAEMPFYAMNSGMPKTPYWDASPLDGESPPVADQTFFTPGTIYIYAHDIAFCDSCARDKVDEQPASEGDPGDVEKRRFFVAAGLKGGRGSLGTVFPCNYSVPAGTTPYAACNEAINDHGYSDQKLGGLSGSPGRGGAGGRIIVSFVSNLAAAKLELARKQAFEQTESACKRALSIGQRLHACDLGTDLGASIVALADMSGGQAAQSGRIQTPSYLALSRDVKKRSDWQVVGPIVDGNLLDGQTGELQIRSISAAQSVDELSSLLSSIDLKNHDLKLSLVTNSGGASDAFVPSIIARDSLDDFLNGELVSRQLGLLNAAEDWVNRRRTPEYPADYFSSLSCTERLPTMMLDNEGEDLLRLCELVSGDRHQPLQSFLTATDGLLSLPTSLATPDVQEQRMIAAVGHLDASVQAMSSTTQRIESLVFERFTLQEKREYEQALDGLRTSLAAVEARLAAQGDVTGRLFAAVKDASAAVAQVAGAYASGDYGGAASGLPNAASRANAVLAILNNEDVSRETRREVEGAKAQLQAMQQAFTNFIKRTDEYRIEGEARADRLQQDVLNSRREASTQKRVFSADFEALVKYSLVNYASSPANSTGQIVTSLRALRQAIGNWPNVSVSSFPVRPPDRCVGVEPTDIDAVRPNELLVCASVVSSSTPVVQTAGAHTKIAGLPVLVIGKSGGKYAVSYGGFLRKADLKTHRVKQAFVRP